MDLESSPTIPRPPKPTHQRSLSKPLSFTATAGCESSSNGQLRNSWSEMTGEEAPPLPPRGQSEYYKLSSSKFCKNYLQFTVIWLVF